MKGYALLIGVDETDSTHYGKNIQLDCALKDVEAMKNFLSGFPEFRKSITTLTSKDGIPTWKKTVEKLNEISSNSKEPSYLVIYYTGHGASTTHKDILGTDTIGFSCFYDQMVSEKQIRDELKNIPSNFKVFLISDSCYGGELINREFKGTSINNNEKSITGNIFDDVIKKNEFHYNGVIKDYHGSILGSKIFEPLAEIAILTACSKKQTTEQNFDNTGISRFTSVLINSWSKSMRFGYRNFLEILANHRPANKAPQLEFFGPKSGFFQQTIPFVINFQTNCINDLTYLNLVEATNDLGKYTLKSLPNSGTLYRVVKAHTYKIQDIPSDTYRRIYAGLFADGCITESTNFICFIEVSLTSGLALPETINDLFKNDAYGEDGYAIVIDDYTYNVLHKGRTKGKVSNTIGGS